MLARENRINADRIRRGSRLLTRFPGRPDQQPVHECPMAIANFRATVVPQVRESGLRRVPDRGRGCGQTATYVAKR